MPPEVGTLSKEQMYEVVKKLNALDKFPLSKAEFEERVGLDFHQLFGNSPFYSHTGEINLDIKTKGGSENLVTGVEISADIAKVPPPPAPAKGVWYDQTSYNYLPEYRVVEPLGEGFYRYLHSPDQEKYKKVNGHSERINPAKWIYGISKERGPYLSESEKKGREEVILSLLNAIKNNQFEEEFEKFKQKYPKDSLGSHHFLGYSMVVVYFNDKTDSPYFGKHLEKEGESEYVGLHIHQEVGVTAKYPQPYLFDFFGIDEIDIMKFYNDRPYVDKPIDTVTDPRPNVSAAGYDKGGLVYYPTVEFRKEGWRFEPRSWYPYDGKTLETKLKKDKLQIDSIEITFSRKKSKGV